MTPLLPGLTARIGCRMPRRPTNLDERLPRGRHPLNRLPPSFASIAELLLAELLLVELLLVELLLAELPLTELSPGLGASDLGGLAL